MIARSPFRLPRLRKLGVPLLAVGLALPGTGCGGLGEPTVVTVGSRSLNARDLRAIYAGMDAGQRSSLATRDERARFVDHVVERLLLEDHGRDLAAAGEGNVEAEVRHARENTMVRRLRTILGSDAPLDSATVRQAYDRMGIRHHVRVASFADEKEARQALASLAPGEGLEALPTYSEDSGLDSWVAWSPLPDPVADLIVEHDPGEVVGPVLARNWWRLLEVVDRRPIEQDDYQALRPRILRGLRVRREAEGTRALLDELLVDARLEFRMPMIETLAERTREAILRPDASENDHGWAVPTLDDEERKRPVVEWRGGRLIGAEYVSLLGDLSRSQRPRSARLELAIRSLVQEVVEHRLLVAEAERRGLGEDWWVRRTVDADRSERLIRLAVMGLEEGHERLAPGDSLLVVLRSSQPQMFRSEARARILRFDLPTRELAEQEIREIRSAGGGPARLRARLEAEAPLTGTYHLLELSRAACPDSDMAREIFEGPRGEPAGPYEALGAWIVAVCLGIEPPRDLTDEEVRTTASAGARRPNIVQEWVQLRRTQLGVTVNQDALDALGPGG